MLKLKLNLKLNAKVLKMNTKILKLSVENIETECEKNVTDRPGKSKMGPQLCCSTVWTPSRLNTITIIIITIIIIIITIIVIIS